MKAITKTEFYQLIESRKLDVVYNVDRRSDYPYTGTFSFRNGKVFGKVVNDFTDGIINRYPIVRKYYINE